MTDEYIKRTTRNDDVQRITPSRVREILEDHSVNGKTFDLEEPSFISPGDFFEASLARSSADRRAARDRIAEELILRGFTKGEAFEFVDGVVIATRHIGNNDRAEGMDR